MMRFPKHAAPALQVECCNPNLYGIHFWKLVRICEKLKCIKLMLLKHCQNCVLRFKNKNCLKPMKLGIMNQFFTLVIFIHPIRISVQLEAGGGFELRVYSHFLRAISCIARVHCSIINILLYEVE